MDVLFRYVHFLGILLSAGILMAVIGLISIHPTVWFIRRRKVPDAEVVDVPPSVRLAVRAQMAIVLLLPLLAVLMARGTGLR